MLSPASHKGDPFQKRDVQYADEGRQFGVITNFPTVLCST